MSKPPETTKPAEREDARHAEQQRQQHEAAAAKEQQAQEQEQAAKEKQEAAAKEQHAQEAAKAKAARQVVQLGVGEAGGITILYVLCSDGTLWHQEAGPQGQHTAPWQQIQTPSG